VRCCLQVDFSKMIVFVKATTFGATYACLWLWAYQLAAILNSFSTDKAFSARLSAEPAIGND
jgi:hypothetical protein